LFLLPHYDTPLIASYIGNDSLRINGCRSLTSISLPQLTTIAGDTFIANNSALSQINGFPLLSYIGRNIDWSGSFEDTFLPSLRHVGGGVNVQSSRNFKCPFSNIQENGIQTGTGFVCTGNISNPASGISQEYVPPDTGRVRNSSKPIGLIVGITIGGVAAALILIWILTWWRKSGSMNTDTCEFGKCQSEGLGRAAFNQDSTQYNINVTNIRVNLEQDKVVRRSVDAPFQNQDVSMFDEVPIYLRDIATSSLSMASLD
jgi:hypothetical protein